MSCCLFLCAPASLWPVRAATLSVSSVENARWLAELAKRPLPGVPGGSVAPTPADAGKARPSEDQRAALLRQAQQEQSRGAVGVSRFANGPSDEQVARARLSHVVDYMYALSHVLVCSLAVIRMNCLMWNGPYSEL